MKLIMEPGHSVNVITKRGTEFHIEQLTSQFLIEILHGPVIYMERVEKTIIDQSVKAVLERFEGAVRAHEMRGTAEPSAREEIDAAYEVAHEEMTKLLEGRTNEGT